MSANSEIDFFVKNGLAYWEAIHDGSSQRANRFERLNIALVDGWVGSGVARQNLSPLLKHSDMKVRLFAAGHLLRVEENKEARAVLEEIKSGPPSLVRISAEAILRVRIKKLDN